jgi:hypothetical protein
LPEINERLKSPNEKLQISGLIALKNLLYALQFDVDADRSDLQSMVNHFFPVIETLLQHVT